MKVPYNYLPFEFRDNKKIFEDWEKLIKSTDFTLGKYVNMFEQKFASYVGSKYCISANNGTDALILALKSLRVGKGDEVITVSNSFYATTGAIISCNAKPILIDCDDRYQIDIDQIARKINKKTKVILPVHWAGASPDMYKISQIAKKYKVKIIEDACMGIGGSLKSKHPGTFGIIGCFSMHPLKSLNVMGDGGMVVTNNKNIYEWMKKFRNHGMKNRNKIDIWGENIRLQPLQAIVALNGLKKLNKVINLRNKNAKYLDKKLEHLFPNIILPKRIKNYKETFSLYMVLAKKRDRLIRYLNKNGIEAKIHYPIPLHKQKAYTINYKKIKLDVSESQAKKIITLPIHQYLNIKQLDYMADKIKRFYQFNN